MNFELDLFSVHYTQTRCIIRDKAIINDIRIVFQLETILTYHQRKSLLQKNQVINLRCLNSERTAELRGLWESKLLESN